jgi:hypothetical protein
MELKVVVPTSLSEITLDQYQRFARLEGDEEFLTHKMLEIFCGVPLAQLPNVKFASVANVMRHINTMFSEKPSLKTEFKLGEHTFGFIPNLEDITFGEYVDLDNYMSDVQDLHKTMAVLYRPVTERAGRRYAIEPYESAGKYADLMKDAPMDAVMGASLFFYRLGNDLITATLTYLESQKTNTHPNHSSVESGDGTLPSISSLKEMLQDLNELDNLGFTKPSPFSFLKKSDLTSNASN